MFLKDGEQVIYDRDDFPKGAITSCNSVTFCTLGYPLKGLKQLFEVF
jgi:hypothetical protein